MTVFPESLHPLPVSEEETGRSRRHGEGGFVEDSRVRQLLVGPLTIDRHPTCYHGHDGSFAGRVELHDSPFMRIAAEEEQEALEHGIQALEEDSVPPASRHRAAPPRPRNSSPAEPATKRAWLFFLVMLVVGGLVGLGLHVLAPLTLGSSGPATPFTPAVAPSIVAPSLASTRSERP